MTVFAATSQQAIGGVLAALLVLGWLAYIAVALRRRRDEPAAQELELAPNRRPYLDDEGLEGPRLTKVLGWALVLLAISSVAPLLYWLREPSRQAGAERGFANRAEERGAAMFQPTDAPGESKVGRFGCATCHGAQGQGGVANYNIETALGTTRQVKWAAPALDTVLLRHTEEEVRTILVYGRANTPMPAWGVLGGGPMNDQQIDDLIAYLDSIKLSKKAAVKRSTEEIQAEMSRPGGPTDLGEAAFNTTCARCHTKGWSYGEPEVNGGGAFGFNLTNGLALRQFPDRADMIEFITEGSEFAKPYGVRGVGTGRMPGFGRQLTEEQIAAIVDYVRGL